MANVYETDTLVDQYLEFHYGSGYLNVPNFPKACVDQLLKHVEGGFDRAFDVGCSVGRSAFELSRVASHVDALDYSSRFIESAQSIKSSNHIQFASVDEGEIKHITKVELTSIDERFKPDCVTFHQGDACALGESFFDYDLVVAFNLLCRLPEPAAFLENIKKRIRPGGYLALSTPCTWMETFTKQSKWLGGYYRDGAPVKTIDGVSHVLEPEFERIGDLHELPFVIRETSRKYQHSFAQFSIWQSVQ